MGKSRKRNRNNQKKYFFMEAFDDLKKERKKKKDKKNKKKSSNYTSYSSYPSSSYYGHTSYSSYSSTPKKQPVQNPDNIINTDKGCFEFSFHKAWGTILVPVEDPKASKVTVDEISGISLNDDFPKIPADLWSRYIDLCFHFCPESRSYFQNYTSSSHASTYNVWNTKTNTYEKYTWQGNQRVLCSDEDKDKDKDSKKSCGFASWNRSGGSSSHNPTWSRSGGSSAQNSNSKDLEVSILLCRKADDLTKWRILVPKQDVSGGSVHAQTAESCDIETGEMITVFPPEGWLHAGSSHSHNSMSAFFSSTDDKSELTVPGAHIVIGNVDKDKMKYEHKASIVLRQLRKKVELFDIVDATPNKATFHLNVLKMVSEKIWSKPASSNSNTKASMFSPSTRGYIQDSDYDDDDDDVHSSPFCCRRREVQTNRRSIGPWSHLEDSDMFDDLSSWAGSGVSDPVVVESEDQVVCEKAKDEQIEKDEEDLLDIENILEYYEEINSRPLQGLDWVDQSSI